MPHASPCPSQVVHRAPAFPTYVSPSVQALAQPAAPAAPPPGAEFVEDEAAKAKANKAALKNLKRRLKNRQQQANGDEGSHGANGDGTSSMGPQASGEWEGLGVGGFGGPLSGDNISITDASGEFYPGGEYEDDLALAMRLQQVGRAAGCAVLCIRNCVVVIRSCSIVSTHHMLVCIQHPCRTCQHLPSA